MTSNEVIRTLRSQAWERAKGELRSMEHTFYSTQTSNPGQFEAFIQAVKEFVKYVEDAGLCE